MTSNLTEIAAAIGTFDGVHRGHAEVISTLVKTARREGLRPVVFTFDRHPLEIVAPDRAPRMLTDRDDRNRLIAESGAEIIEIPFNENIRNMTAAQWMEKLKSEFNTRVIILGYDNTFGSDGIDMRIGDFRQIGKKLGIQVEVAPIIRDCSSSAIRKALKKGDISSANRMLGRNFSVRGIVTHGRGYGRKIGIPTANITIAENLIMPSPGVYVTDVTIDSDSKSYRAVTNIGTAPTVTHGTEYTIETHIPGLSRDIYDTTLRLEFLTRLRDEKKFSDAEQLKEAIRADIESMFSFKPN